MTKMASASKRKRGAGPSENGVKKTPRTTRTNSFLLEAKSRTNSVTSMISDGMEVLIENDDEWEHPKKPAKRKLNTTNDESIPVSPNKFNNLETNEIPLTNSTSQHEQVNPDETAGKSDQTVPNGADRGQQKSYRQQLIFILGNDIKDTANKLICEEIKSNSFKIRQNNGNHTIQANDKVTYDAIKKRLTSLEMEYYTYTPLENKPQTIVLKNIYGNFDAVDVGNALTL
ncbi:hypothetical protein KQX54_009975 [Cotesia glomerata]|uniref:Uncharacterized protein n=1 Tax=Cotesia glomerata TaxID=32391 RepID=A0AAV7HVX1_COTGL|nr:hypothetical protein KQX54_009975 [Cotesia glomerata]